MPPKAKFTKEEIVEAGLSIVREGGIDSLTARTLGDRLGSSARPIFTVFKSMDEVHQAVIGAAREVYDGYIGEGLSETLSFKGVGAAYIRFAIVEPKLFQLLFMSEQASAPNIDKILPSIEENYERILNSITEGYGLDEKTAERLYRHLWIYSHGIAALCATKMCCFTGAEISEMITEVFISLLDKMKNQRLFD